MNNKDKIAELLNSRHKIAECVDEKRSEWSARRARIDALKSGLREMQKVCLRAQATGSEAFADLSARVKKYDDSGILRTLSGQCDVAEGHLEKLQRRFRRDTVNIAVAGVGRCGKSTALKALIGQDQDDNSVIPSGEGPAVTAGKSIIRCVTEARDEHTEVTFHTGESFLNAVVNPLLSSISLSEYCCTSLEQFGDLDFDLLKEALALNEKKANDTVRALRLTATDEAQRIQLSGAQAYAASFKLNCERLGDLRRIMNAFPTFSSQLKGQTERVSINETARYVSYPTDGSPALCYAVRECRIFSRFPNNDVSELELTDLPGLGTGSASERKCFLDGFDYSVDLALMARRPVGLFQNFTTDDDIAVLDVLGKTFGEDHLHECMVLFQNDGGLDPSAADAAFSRIGEWNSLRTSPVKVIRGDAIDSSYMQKKLLPDALQFIGQNLPRLDEALLNAVLPALETSAQTIDAEVESIQSELGALKHRFASGCGANAISEKTSEILNTLMVGLSELMNFYSDGTKQSDARQSEAITKLTDEAKKTVDAKYDFSDSGMLSKVSNSIMTHQSAIPYANGEIHALRIAIGEVFAKLENIHAGQVAEMQDAVAKKLKECFPAIGGKDATLSVYLSVFEKSRCCPEVVSALRDLLTLEVPFYNILYPDLRKEVFDMVPDLERNFMAISGMPKEKQSEATLRELTNVGKSWIWKCESFLRAQSRIQDILCAAIERFQDRMVRNAVTRHEMIDFIERNWSSVQSDADAFASDVHMKLEKLTA